MRTARKSLNNAPMKLKKNRAMKILQEPSAAPDLADLLKGTDATPDEIFILRRIFQLEAKKRISASQLLCYPFFDGTPKTRSSLPCIPRYSPPEIIDPSTISL